MSTLPEKGGWPLQKALLGRHRRWPSGFQAAADSKACVASKILKNLIATEEMFPSTILFFFLYLQVYDLEPSRS